MEWHGHFKCIVEHHLEQAVLEAGWNIESFYTKLRSTVTGTAEEQAGLKASAKDVLTMIEEMQQFEQWAGGMRKKALQLADN
jgi:hypothetical protein